LSVQNKVEMIKDRWVTTMKDHNNYKREGAIRTRFNKLLSNEKELMNMAERS